MNKYYISNIDCENCARKIEAHLKKQFDLETAEINMVAKTLVIDKKIDASTIERTINQIEKGVVVSGEKIKEEEIKKFNWPLFRMICAFVLLGLGVATGRDIMFLIGYFFVGYPVILLAFKNMIHKQFFDEYFLMTVATFAAISINQYSEALAVMLFYSVGEYIQDKTMDSTKKSISSLAKIVQREAILVKDGETQLVSVEELQIGDVIRVPSGERVAVDSKLIAGTGSIDNSHITGESEPLSIEAGDFIYGGGINTGGMIDVEVTKLASESTIAKLVDLVTYADSKKTKTEQFITRFSKIYTPIVVIIAILIVLLFPIMFNIPLEEAVYRSVTLLVISCPCAFVISVPLGYVVGIGTLSKEHILVKGSQAIDNLQKISIVASDKTGTLTTGKFEVRELENFSTLDYKFIYSIVASGERNVVHPIATSLVNYCMGNGGEYLAVQNVETIDGTGISFQYDSKTYKLVKSKEDTNYTTSNLLENDKLVASFKISDQLKPESIKFSSRLKSMGIQLHMLTGDKEKVGQEIGGQLSLEKNQIHTNLLPNDKLDIVEQLISKDQTVAFIGDGLNDAAVIKRSDVGVAMGMTGSEFSVESSDVVISNDNIYSLIYAINVSKKTNKIMKQNIALAFIVKIIFIILGLVGLTTMWEAVFSDVGVTLIAIANSMRIKRVRNE